MSWNERIKDAKKACSTEDFKKFEDLLDPLAIPQKGKEKQNYYLTCIALAKNKNTPAHLLKAMSAIPNDCLKMAMLDNLTMQTEQDDFKAELVELLKDNSKPIQSNIIGSFLNGMGSSQLEDLSNMIKRCEDDSILERMDDYSSYASWTVWDESGKFSSTKLKEKLKSGCVLVALNPSFPATDNWTSFHEGENDGVLQKAIEETSLEGCYITDLIKSHIEPDSKLVENSLSNRIIEYNSALLRAELNALGGVNVLCAIGRSTYLKLINDYRLRSNYKIIEIPHFSNHWRFNNDKDDYCQTVIEALEKYNLAERRKTSSI